MRKNILTVGIIILVGIGSYIGGTRQVKEVRQIETVEKEIEVIPDGYIDSTSDDFYDTYLDVSTIVSYDIGTEGILFHMEDGNGYYLEVGQEME